MKGRRDYLKRADSLIRLSCRRLTGRQRKLLVGVAFLLFTAACLYSILSPLSGSGQPERSPEIRHIRSLDLRPEKKKTIHSNNEPHEKVHPKNQGVDGLVRR